MKQHEEEVLEFIHGDPDTQDEERFNRLALTEFERQYHMSKPYRTYCKRKNVSPETITAWEDIPAVSSFDFEKLLAASFPVEKAERICLTSRTFDLKNRSERMYVHKWDKAGRDSPGTFGPNRNCRRHHPPS